MGEFGTRCLDGSPGGPSSVPWEPGMHRVGDIERTELGDPGQRT